MCDPTLFMSNILIDSSDGLPRRKRYWERPDSSLNGLWRHITDDAIENRDSLTSNHHLQLSNIPCENRHHRNYRDCTMHVSKILLQNPRVKKSAGTTQRYTNFTQNSSWSNTVLFGPTEACNLSDDATRSCDWIYTTHQDVVPLKYLFIIILFILFSISFWSFISITFHHTVEPRVKHGSIRQNGT